MPYIGKQPSRTAFDSDDIPNNSITAAKIVDGAITIADIADDAVTADKLANSINAEIAANTAKVTNATHTGEVTGSTTLTIANNAITNSKMADDAIGIAELSATGTASSTTYLRGDNSWAAVSSGATGGGTDQVFVNNSQTITTDYTIPSGKSASSTGPITMNSGVDITLSAGSRWVIL